MSSPDEVIEFLKTHPGFNTVRTIAFNLGVTPRTVQNYLKIIRDDDRYQIEASQDGISLSSINAAADQDEREMHIPQNYEERKKWIIRRCIINNEEIPMSKMSGYFGISYTTLQKEINRLKKELAPYKLRIRIHDDNLTVFGSDYFRKNYISDMIYEEAEDEILTPTMLDEIFPGVDAGKVRDILTNELKRNQYYMDEFSLMNIVLHILISLNTYGTKEHASNAPALEERVENAHFVNMVESMCTAIEKEYSNHFSNDEKYQLYVLLTTRVIRNDDVLANADLEELTDVRTAEFMKIILRKVSEVYKLDLSNHNFTIGFALHLYNLLIRIDGKVKLRNPMLQDIKVTSPFIYDIAVFISQIITDETGFDVSDDEISYIALHVGVRLEEIRNTSNKLNAYIICPNYYSSLGRQVQKISEIFSNEIYISQILTNPADLHALGVPDLIVSTVPIAENNPNVIQVSNFISDNDRMKIENAIHQTRKMKEKQAQRETLGKLFSSKLFSSGKTYADKEEALKDVCQRMYAARFVGSDYYQKTKEREEISPTNFGRMAIPHPVNYYSPQTVIEVTTLKKPVEWNSSQISIIFTIAISRKDFPEFQNIFSFLTSICMDPEAINLLCSAEEYDEFMETMMRLYDQ